MTNENELAHIRANGAAWKDLAYCEERSTEYGVVDANEAARNRMLLRLQYDCQDSDLELVRFLFDHEVTAAEEASFQGCDGPLLLAAVLLARFRKPEDLPRFVRAKMANYDTFSGFPSEFCYIICDDPVAWFEANRPDILAENDILFSSEDAQLPHAWWEKMEAAYPRSESEETELGLFQRALAFDDQARARDHLERWNQQTPDSAGKQRRLKYEYRQLGLFREAADVVGLMLAEASTDWDKASKLRDLVDLLRQSEDWDEAMDAAVQLDGVMGEFTDWHGVGLGRMCMESIFALAEFHPDVRAANAAFEMAERRFRESPDLPLVGLQGVARAAQRLGLESLSIEFRRLADLEWKRIDEQLGSR